MHRLRIAIFFITAVFLAAARPSFAGLNRWTSNGPEGAWITALVTDPGDARIVYAGTAGGGVFRSSVGGQPRWERVGADLPEAAITVLAIDPALPSTVYAGTNNGRLFRSGDRGDRWTELPKPATGHVRAIAVDRERSTIYVGTDDGFLLSADDGVSWRFVPELTGQTVNVALLPDGAVFVSRTNGMLIYVSTNGGASWQLSPVTGGILGVDRQSSTLYASGFLGIRATGDGGTTLRLLPPLNGPITELIPAANRLYAVTERGLFEHILGTENTAGNSAWKPIGGFTQPVRAMALLSASPRNLYAGTRAGILVSLDGEDALKPGNDGMNAAFVNDLASVGNDIAHAATPAGLFQTADGAASWRKAADVDEALTLVEANGAAEVYVAGARGLRRSDDGGTSWTTIKPGATFALAATRSSPATLYAGFSEGLLKSADAGRTWTSAMSGLVGTENTFYYGYGYATALETDDADPATAYMSYDAGLFKTSNGGQTWRGVLADARRNNFIPAVAGHGAIIHAAFFQGVTTSVDGGVTWSERRLIEESVRALVIDPIHPERSYAGTASGRVYRSDDSGNEWVLFSDGLRHAPVHRLELSEPADRIYAATAGGVYEYRIGTAVAFERLPDDSLRLPQLLRQLPTGLAGNSGTGFVLPAVGTVRGSRESVFRTDVTLSNRRENEQAVIVSWLPQGNAASAPTPMFRITLPPSNDEGGGGTLTIADIAEELGFEGLGAMMIVAVDASGRVDAAADIDGFARIRSAASCGAGSVSQSLAAVSAQGFGSHRRGRALGLRHESGYRTNVGIVNLSERSREFTVRVDGERRSERITVSVPPFSSMLAGIPDGNYGAVAVRFAAEGDASPWVAYGSSVDNASGDSWASVAVPLRER
jgi:photosystem II stability/assembly factor-like uncharacterized protein